MTDAVLQKVIQIIAEQAMVDASEVNGNTNLEELGLDSLSLVEVVFGIEEAFDISVPYNANDPDESDFALTDVNAVVKGVKSLISEKGTA